MNKTIPSLRTAISLHSHTLYSIESLDFIERATAGTPWLSGAIRKELGKYRASQGRDLDLKRAWWTPPLSPLQAWNLEREQIEETLGSEALVSLSDHDNINACMHLQALEETRKSPISIEWTVPFRQTFFHIGVHNIPADTAVEMTRAMNQFTAEPDEKRIGPMLEYLGAPPRSLVVLNHPMWDENHIGEAQHFECVRQFLSRFSRFLHALELNGLRPANENKKAGQLAQSFFLPVVSGGDRHGREPNACVNLTDAVSFGEFADEVRNSGRSHVLFLPQYRMPLKIRILENMVDILDDDPGHAMGWKHWSNRVFYRSHEGPVKSLQELWGSRFPAIVNQFVSLMRIAKHRRVKSILRMAFHEEQEFAL